MFEDSIIEGRKTAGKRWIALTSVAIQGTVLSAFIVVPAPLAGDPAAHLRRPQNDLPLPQEAGSQNPAEDHPNRNR